MHDDLPQDVTQSIQRILEIEPAGHAEGVSFDAMGYDFSAVAVLNSLFPEGILRIFRSYREALNLGFCRSLTGKHRSSEHPARGNPTEPTERGRRPPAGTETQSGPWQNATHTRNDICRSYFEVASLTLTQPPCLRL